MSYKQRASTTTANKERDLSAEVMSGLLGPGEHTVRIRTITDEEDYWLLTLATALGDRYTGRIYRLAPDGKDLSSTVKALLAATASSPEELFESSEEMMASPVSLSRLKGKQLKVRLVKRDRYINIETFGRVNEERSSESFSAKSFYFPNT